MNKLLQLIEGFAERFTLNILSIVKAKDETLIKVKEAFNEKEGNLKEIMEDLKSKDPSKLDSYINFEKIFGKIKPFVIATFVLVALYLVFKIYQSIKKK